MYRIIATCDSCKKEKIVLRPECYPYHPDGWREIQLAYYGERSGEKYLVCDECLPKFGLVTEPNHQQHNKSTADKLLELIQEVVQENVEYYNQSK